MIIDVCVFFFFWAQKKKLQVYHGERNKPIDGAEWWLSKLKSNQVIIMVVAVIGTVQIFASFAHSLDHTSGELL